MFEIPSRFISTVEAVMLTVLIDKLKKKTGKHTRKLIKDKEFLYIK